MTLQMIKDLLHGTKPFIIRMVSGRTISIPHPDFVALSQSEALLVFTTLDDRVEVVRINQIESIDTPALPPTA